jgi:mRNA interferase RelE/StbE
MLKSLSDRRIRRQIFERIEQLAKEPEKQGKPLRGDLAGYRSIRVAQQRYRVIYRVELGQVRVIVIAAGIRRDGGRRDVYRLAQRLIRLGLVEPNGESKR